MRELRSQFRGAAAVKGVLRLRARPPSPLSPLRLKAREAPRRKEEAAAEFAPPEKPKLPEERPVPARYSAKPGADARDSCDGRAALRRCGLSGPGQDRARRRGNRHHQTKNCAGPVAPPGASPGPLFFQNLTNFYGNFWNMTL